MEICNGKRTERKRFWKLENKISRLQYFKKARKQTGWNDWKETVIQLGKQAGFVEWLKTKKQGRKQAVFVER